MGYVGGLPFFRIDNPVQMPGVQLEVFTRPGVAGVGFQTVGFHGSPYGCRVVACYIGESYRNVAILACNSLRGNLVTVVDDMGVYWYNLRVMDFQLGPKWNTVNGSIGGILFDYWFEGQFLLMPTATSY